MKIDAPRISVIVPVYNSEKTLHRCIDSILAQTYTDFELLIIDDGSTDSSDEIIEAYVKTNKGKIRAYHKENGGVSSARNLGLIHAKGEWVTFCDSDDYVLPEWLAFYDVENSKEFDLICQGIRADKSIFGNSLCKEMGFEYEGDVKGLVKNLVEKGTFGYLFVKCFRRFIISTNNLGFDIKVRFQEDELFLTEYLKYVQNAKCITQMGYFYNVPNWVKYKGCNVDLVIYRTERILSNLYLILGANSKAKIIQGKLESLNLYLMEAYFLNKERNSLKRIRKFYQCNGNFKKVPAIVRWLIVKDSTYSVLWLGLNMYNLFRILFKKHGNYI